MENSIALVVAREMSGGGVVASGQVRQMSMCQL